MRLIDDVARELLEELRETVDSQATARQRLERAIGPCTLQGGREGHLELVLHVVEQAKDES